MNRQDILEDKLDSFNAEERYDALEKLAAEGLWKCPPEGANVNMHFHSFFSYNAEGYSPSHVAWEARKHGLHAAGLCDFDVLDGLEEFLVAGQILALRTAVSVETRAYLKDFAHTEISSPGEPGVTYIMGAGFFKELGEGTPQAAALKGYRDRARARNVALVERVNPHLPDVAIDYDRDVRPLTPAGAATERHLITAYINKARERFGKPEADARYWGRVLGITDPEQALLLIADLPRLEELVRAKLCKKGGLGYEQPSPSTFPPVEEFVRWVKSCEALPMITWLDGTSEGEKDAARLLDCLIDKGCVALNIIPDRNWNLKDPAQRKIKQANLKGMVAEAVKRDLPINIGTEMNKLGLPFTDDLAGEVLSAYREPFTRGAHIMVGHTLLARYAGFSYVSPAAAAEFPNRAARNRFFEAVGALPPCTEEQADTWEDLGPEKTLAWFRDRVKKSG
jgi:hypothetical protein